MPGRHIVEMTGKRFGRLTVLGRAANKNFHACWECVCTCGSPRTVSGDDLRQGRSNSCGCLKRELSSARLKARRTLKKG
jgi:hypothetical protein